jgi:NTE family protein
LGFNPRGAVYRAVAACLPNFGIRREYFDLEYVLDKACPHFADIIWDNVEARLLIGASEAINGYETVFDSDLNKTNAEEVPIERWRQRLPLSLAGVAASGTLPAVREAQQIKGCGFYWDGLYSQNPPVREFVEDRTKAADEVWILRINPQQWPRLPETIGEIRDRENELMGNLSLHKDLDFIQKVNQLSREVKRIKEGHDALQTMVGEKDDNMMKIGAALKAVEPLLEKEVVVRTIKMRKQTCDELQYSSKFNRGRDVLNRLRDEGLEVGEEWLRDWPNHMTCYPDDAGYQT